MENIEKTPVTPEIVMEIIREISLSIKESRKEIAESRKEIAASRAKFDLDLAESRAEWKQRMEESDKKLDRDIAKSRAEWKQELAESRAEWKQDLAESRAEWKQELAESRAEWEQELAKSRAEWKQELAESRAEWNLKMKELNEMIGGTANSNEMFAEEYFFNCIEKGDKTLFGEKFDECYSSLKRYNKNYRKKSEHDILLVNGKSVAIVEIKYKARKEDIQKIINKLPDFRMLYPQYRSHRIYLGLAAMSFDNGVENETINNGLAIIKQVGGMVVINDEHLKAF